jgi:hypothetical protein
VPGGYMGPRFIVISEVFFFYVSCGSYEGVVDPSSLDETLFSSFLLNLLYFRDLGFVPTLYFSFHNLRCVDVVRRLVCFRDEPTLLAEEMKTRENHFS